MNPTYLGIGVLLLIVLLNAPYLVNVLRRRVAATQPPENEAAEHILALYRIRDYFQRQQHQEGIDRCNELGKCFFH